MSKRLSLIVSLILVASVSLPIFQPVASQVVPTVTVTSTVAWQNNFGSNPACGYPFNPYYCNEGQPVTIGGYLTSDESCTFLYDGQGVNYAVWNLPRHQQYPSGTYQVYGYVYPDWPLGIGFPPYPFQRTTCTGTPLWAIPPYIQSGIYNGRYPTPCIGQNCWNTVTVYGWLPTMNAGSGCVNLYTNPDQRTIKSILWNAGSNYLPGYVAVTGVFQQMDPCGGTVLSVLSINPAYSVMP
jgi:hypothetical protein